jgi:predicted phage-related endonuclease
MSESAIVSSPHFVPGLSLTPEQIAERRNRIGASEMPAIAGLSKHVSPLELWATKRGLIAPFNGNEATEWGTRLEAVVADAYAEKMNVAVERCDTIIIPEGWRSATPDRKVIEPRAGQSYPNIIFEDTAPWLRGLEVKCRGHYSALDFGEAGTDQVPDEVAIQCHATMSVLRVVGIVVERWDVATLIGGNQFRSFILPYDAQIDADLTELAYNFWHKYVLPGIEPPVDASAATTEYLKQKFKQNSEVLLTATVEQEEALAHLQRVREEISALEKEEAQLKNQFMEWIGEAAGIKGRTGRVTWKTPNGTSVKWKDVAEALGADARLIAKYSTPLGRRFSPFFPKK